MLVLVLFARHIVDEGIMLFYGIHITSSTLGIEEEDLTILHANHEIYIEEGFVPLLVLITDGIMLPAGITILIPPVNILPVGFQESFETFFRLRGIL